MDATFFDADGDKDLDLYVVSGGSENLALDGNLQDRLYFNNGKGSFSKKENVLPDMPVSGGVVAPVDVDGDGDIDLFIGSRQSPANYPEASSSFFLLNDGKGKFSIDGSPLWKEMGMVTDAPWTD